MDTLTHAISGAVIGIATSSRDPAQLRRRALWGALFAAFPDSDVLISFVTDHFTYLNEHRGYTHSLIMLPLWASLLGLLAARVSRMRWRDMALLAAAALVAHILGDLITSYGTKVFKPVYDAPLAFPITFIIDPLFTGILLAGLIAALVRSSPRWAAASGIVLTAYLVLQTFAQQSALAIGHEYAGNIGARDAPVIAFPQPLSPFNWKIVIVDGGNYHYAYANLLESEPRSAAANANLFVRLRAAYQPTDLLHWKTYSRWPKQPEYRDLAMAAWAQEAFAGFRQFALLPYVTSIRGDARNVCVWFTDLRFTLSAMDAPFEYAMCRDESGTWSLELDRAKSYGEPA